MRIFIFATVIVAAFAVGCDGRDVRDGLLRDADGNAYVLRGMLDGRTWMTEYDSEHAWFYNFGRGGGLLNRHSGGDKSLALAVRCINASRNYDPR